MARMLVTRPEPDASQSVTHLRAIGIEAVSAPMLSFETLGTSLPEAQGFAAMALTSSNALRALDARGAINRFRKLKVFAVGDATAAEAKRAGFSDVESAGGNLALLVQRLAHTRLTGPIFYPSGRQPAGDLAKSLAPYGVMVVTARVYDMVPCREIAPEIMAQLQGGTIDAALFYSRRTAQSFLDCVGQRLNMEERRHLAMLCISESVAEPLIAAHFVRISLADQPDEDAMMSLALSFARERDNP